MASETLDDLRHQIHVSRIASMIINGIRGDGWLVRISPYPIPGSPIINPGDSTSKVIEMRSRGLCQTEISNASISLDMQYMRSQAKESIREYVTEHLPEQYQVCLTALDAIIKRAFDIFETSPDNREKLQAMDLFKDTHLVKLTNATVVNDAIRFVSEKSKGEDRDQIKSSSSSDSSGNEDDMESKKHDYIDEKSDKVGEEKQEQETGEITVNQVF